MSRGNTTIKRVHARWVLDSRGLPTVEAEVLLEDGSLGRAIVPSGKSKGLHEALEIRDKTRDFHGKHVLKAVENVNKTISGSIVGMDAANQEAIDKKLIQLDGTENKSRLGANAVLSVSLACAKAAAASQGIPLFKHVARLVGRREDRYLIPLPMCNLVNGGKHGVGSLTIQEFMLQPLGAKTFGEAIRWICEIYHTLKNLLSKTFGENTTLVGDEGGFSGINGNTRDVLTVLEKAVEETGYSLGEEIVFALDAAANEFYDPGRGVYGIDGENLAVDELIDFWVGLVGEYPINSLEDPISQDDWMAWKQLTHRIGDRVMVVGDDLLTTNPKRVKRALEEHVCSGILLKPNQVGTLSECLEVFKLGRLWGVPSVVSHRSGETEDTTISHISVGLSNGQIKTGSVARSERNAKYNELLRIEEFLGGKARFVGDGFRDVWKDMW